jgi:hypothetical protein
VLAVVGALYAATAARHVLGEDNGEFATIYAAGGVAHPPGYPLYTLLLRAFWWVPAATPAQGAALVTAAIGLTGVWVLYAACRAWGAGPGAAALAATAYGTAPLAWDLCTKAEVFALNATLAAGLLWAAAPEGTVRGARRAALVGLLFGLGLSNHHTVLMLTPIAVCGMLEALAETPHRAHAAALSAAGVVLGLLPYASLPLSARASDTAWVWGDVTTASGLVHHFLRRDFGTTRLAVNGAAPAPLATLTALARTLLVDLRIVPAFVGLGVLVAGTFRRSGLRRATGNEETEGRRPPSRVAMVTLFAAFLFAGPGFALVTNVELSPEGTAIVRRFQLLPLLVLCLPFALGAQAALRRLRPALQAALVATALAGGALLGYGDVRDEHGPMLENYVIDTLETATPGAVVLGSGDARVFGILYAQAALGLRRDVVFVSPILLHYSWYRERTSRALGLSIASPVDGSVDTVALAGRILGTNRRLFLSDLGNGVIPRAFPTYPLGTLIEVLPLGAFPPGPRELEAENLALFVRYRPDPALLDLTRAWSRGARDAYARPWNTLAAAYRAAGDELGARRNAERATLAPWLP